MIMQTMMNFILVTVLLLRYVSWISALSEFHTEAQSGEQVTLLCYNFSAAWIQIIWFTAVRKLEPICYMFDPSEPAVFSNGYTNHTYEATTNISALFLKIKRVDLSDSGLYFCGYYQISHLVITSATYLEVQGSYTDVKQISGIFGGVIVFLTLVIVGLVVRIKQPHKDHTKEPESLKTRSQGSDDLIYTAVSFTMSSRMTEEAAGAE